MSSSGCMNRETAIEYGEWMCRSALASIATFRIGHATIKKPLTGKKGP